MAEKERKRRSTVRSVRGVAVSDAQRAAVIRVMRGENASDVARSEKTSAETLKRWCGAYFRSKLAYGAGSTDETTGLVHAKVRIRRDTWGVAHIQASSERDLFFGLGYAMAQERLWQLDYQRRLVRGELAAILGRRFLGSDRDLRILGMGEAGDRAWETASDDERMVLEALAAGIDRWAEQVGSRLPVEFEVLGYAPRPWTPADSIAIWKHRAWSNCGRIDLIVLSELARQTLPAELYEAFAAVELADENIVHSTEYDSHGASTNGPGAGALDEGSNNWAVAGARTTTDAPVLCSDPHNVFGAPSQWFEAQLTCPSFDAGGAVYIGTPALYLGRNRDVAWGLTNHMISVRDLFREEVDPARPDHYRDGDDWRPFVVEEQSIAVAGEANQPLEIRHTTRGPIVNDILPRLDVTTKPLSLRWTGAEVPSGFDSSLGLLRARSASGVLEALRKWTCPPLNYVYADRNGEIGYHAAGYVPMRARGGYGIRKANDPDDAWDGLRSFDDLPNVANPERGWVATANNVPWTREAWYVETGSWSDGYRAHRIRERLTSQVVFTPEEISAIHADVVSVRARELLPGLLDVIRDADHLLAPAVIRVLRRWNFACTTASVGPSIWTAFWTQWCLTVAGARFPREISEIAAQRVGGVARRLLLGEDLPWFAEESAAEARIRRCFAAALDTLERWGGSDVHRWRWGRLHQVTHPHPMSATPALKEMYDTGPFPTSGGATVRAAGHGFSPPFDAVSGSTYRFRADLSQPDRMVSVQTLGQSAHLGSPHYRDQTRLWLADSYHPLWMNEADVAAQVESETTITPSGNLTQRVGTRV